MPEETVIQHIVMPSGIAEGDEGLYVRGTGGGRFPLSLRKGEVLDLCAHFNFLPIGRLREDADTGEILLRLTFEGSLRVRTRAFGPGSETAGDSFRPRNGDGYPLDCSQGDLLGLSVEAEEDTILYSGEFVCRPEHVKNIRLAHAVCTYRREDELRDKLDRIDTYLKEYPELKDHLKILIVDNGGTLGDIQNGHTELIQPGRNLGGSGGFARGMLEALSGDSTHVLLNDDDARLDPEILFRTVSYYSLLKDGLSDTMLGASMLRLDRPCTVHESGAQLIRSKPHALKNGLDLSRTEDNIGLVRRERIDYLGWWYITVPLDSVRRDGLPLPMFVKIDDVEYGIRSPSRKTTMCGISVWHPPFSSGYSASSVYYSHRNILAALASERMLDRERISEYFERAVLDTACLRYVSADATVRAVKDFLKGPDALFGMCAEGPIAIENYRYGDVSELEKELRPRQEKTAGFRFRKYTLNGLILPSCGDVTTDFGEMHTDRFYRAGKALYTADGKKGTLCRRSLYRAMCQIAELYILKRKVLRRMEKLNGEYGAAAPRYSSENYWKDLFGH